MDMVDVSAFFDQDPVLDGYLGDLLFYAQAASFDDSASDGSTNRRRVLSVAPDVVLPDRRVVSIYDEVWLVGDPTTDGFQGERMRKNYAMRRSTGLMAIWSPGDAAAPPAVPTQIAHGHKLWFKDVQTPLTTSDYETFWNISFAPFEDIKAGYFLEDVAGTLFRVRESYLPIQGLTIAQSDELPPDARQTVTFITGSTFDPVADAYAPTTIVTTGLFMPTGQLYRSQVDADPLVKPGDMTLLVDKDVHTPRVGDKLTAKGFTWNIVQLQPELDAWLMRVRR